MATLSKPRLFSSTARSTRCGSEIFKEIAARRESEFEQTESTAEPKVRQERAGRQRARTGGQRKEGRIKEAREGGSAGDRENTPVGDTGRPSVMN